MRRGFTLIELALAVAMSSVILLAAFGAFASLGRSHRELGDRFRQNADLERTRIVVKRAIESLVVAQESPPRPNAASPGGGESTIDAFVRPSFFLSHEEDSTAEMPAPRASMKAVDDLRKPQRFECTLSRPLISSTASEADEQRRRERGTDVLERHANLGRQGSASATRGVFEMTPDRTRSGEPTGLWNLSWRPIRAAVLDRVPSYLPAEDDEVVPLLEGARSIRWLAFQDSKMKASYTTSYMTELPAYLVLEVEMPSGLSAQWMFEIGITVGAEFDANDLTPPVDSGGTGDGESMTPPPAQPPARSRATPSRGRGSDRGAQ